MLGTHVVGLYDLAQCQYHEGHGLTALDSAVGFLTKQESDQGQCGEHSTLQHNTNAETVSEDAFLLGLGLSVHYVGFHSFHTQRNGGQGVGHQIDPQKLHRKQGSLVPQDHSEEYGENLTDIGAQQEADHLADIGIDAAALAHCVYDGGEVVIRQGHVSGTLGYVRTGDTHSASDIGGLQGGSIVYTVTGHRYNLALTLPSLYDADLVFGGNAGVYGNIFNLCIQFGVGHSIQLGTGDSTVALFQNTQFPCDGGCGNYVVTCDHNRLDSGTAANRNGILGLGAGRVDHTNQTHEGQSVFQFLRGRILGDFINFFIGHSQHAECVLAHGFGELLGGVQITGDAAGRHHIKGTLHDDDVLVIDAIDGSHQLAVGVEGNLGQTGELLVQIVLRHTVLVSGQYDGGLSGIADVLFFRAVEHNRAVAAQSAIHQQLLDRIGVGVANAFYIVSTVYVRLGERHAVLCQGTGLVGADDRCATQGFYSGQAADQCIFLNHALYTDGENDGYDSGKALRDSGYSQRNGGHKHMEGIQIVCQTDCKDDSAGTQCHDTQVFAQLCQFLLQRSLTVLFALQQVSDLTHLGIHTGSGNNGSSRTVGHAAAGEYHIVTVAERRLQIHLSSGVLLRGNGFTGQGGFFALQADAVQQAGVGGDEVAGFQTDDITGHQFSGLDDFFLSIADDTGVGGRQILQCIQCFFRLAFLIYTHDRVQDNDQNDQTGLEQLTPVLFHADDRQRHDGRGDEDQDHYILKLIHKALKSSFLFLFTELVGTVLCLTGTYFLRGKTAFFVGGKGVQDVFYVIVVECQCNILLKIIIRKNDVRVAPSHCFQWIV